MHSETWLESDHPGRSKKEASRHFLALAATPPHEEGITPARQLRHFFHSSYDRALFPEINEARIDKGGMIRHDENDRSFRSPSHFDAMGPGRNPVSFASGAGRKGDFPIRGRDGGCARRGQEAG